MLQRTPIIHQAVVNPVLFWGFLPGAAQVYSVQTPLKTVLYVTVISLPLFLLYACLGRLCVLLRVRV